MPKRTDIHNILIIGSGPIIVGQACEFDYAGAQACMAIKEEGYRTVLLNSNPASMMTDPAYADVTYIEPILPSVVKKIIEKEGIDAILTTVGGQVALNLAYELSQSPVQFIGADRKIIEKAENRKRFQEILASLHLQYPRGYEVNCLEDAQDILQRIALPLVIRSSFTLGGKGAVIVHTAEEFTKAVQRALELSPIGHILIEESIAGWKEFELEVIRDRRDNCIVVCSIENIDPMGIHTGDSIAVAPAMTLSDKEYQKMRDQAFAIMRAVGVETGGANVQFAVNPKDGRMLVIEMNPRVSRSSALASKATGYPIARIAAKLALGFTLDEVQNELTGEISAAFEPTIDYVVTKIPRFDFEKFPTMDDRLSLSMQSIGEAMGIGRSFKDAFQKALRSLDKGYDGLLWPYENVEILRESLQKPSSKRALCIAEAMRQGWELSDIHQLTCWDPWFLREIKELIEMEKDLQAQGLPATLYGMAHLKSAGMSDRAIAHFAGKDLGTVRQLREQFGVRPSVFKIDSCSGQFSSELNYLYLTFQKDGSFENESTVTAVNDKKVIIFGSGPNCISQGIEFDYCSVHAAQSVKEMGCQAVMVNCNPDTVSTDHSVSDKLYFSPLVEEDIAEIISLERKEGHLLGALVQFGGQTALKCAAFLKSLGVSILGTSQEAIDLTEDRNRFRELADALGINQPCNDAASDQASLKEAVERIGYPVILRPSYVIGGKGMEVIETDQDLERSPIYRAIGAYAPVLVEEFLLDAKEVEVDLLSDGKEICVLGIVEHFEKAGIHSGDSYFSLPPFSLTGQILNEVRDAAHRLAMALQVVGLMNIQFAIKGQTVFVLEANLRASRTIPFLSKAVQMPIVNFAAKVALGVLIKDLGLPACLEVDKYYLKQPIFSFATPSSIRLGPQMRSTGEQMFIGKTFEEAFRKLVLSLGIDMKHLHDASSSAGLSRPLMINNSDLLDRILSFKESDDDVEFRSIQEWEKIFRG